MAVLLATSGCAGNRGGPIPSDAIDMGGGRAISVVAPANGRVWIYDKEKNLVVFKGRVKAGDRVSLNAASNNLVIGGTKLDLNPHLEPRHRYRIYFKQ